MPLLSIKSLLSARTLITFQQLDKHMMIAKLIK